ncbi:hypothetical protein [Parathermosynechococcus lividus]|nr:hypothetical protein [Thermostichus lividus]
MSHNTMDRNPLELLQQAYYAGIGAVTAAVESLQDEAKRQENLAQLRLDLRQLASLWAEKGRVTEAEARRLIESFVTQQTAASTPQPTSSAQTKAIEADIKLLIETLRAVRHDLQQEQNSPAP